VHAGCTPPPESAPVIGGYMQRPLRLKVVIGGYIYRPITEDAIGGYIYRSIALKIVIFHTKYPKNVRASLRSAQFF
jgi:hypothetical protein